MNLSAAVPLHENASYSEIKTILRHLNHKIAISNAFFFKNIFISSNEIENCYYGQKKKKEIPFILKCLMKEEC